MSHWFMLCRIHHYYHYNIYHIATNRGSFLFQRHKMYKVSSLIYNKFGNLHHWYVACLSQIIVISWSNPLSRWPTSYVYPHCMLCHIDPHIVYHIVICCVLYTTFTIITYSTCCFFSVRSLRDWQVACSSPIVVVYFSNHVSRRPTFYMCITLISFVCIVLYTIISYVTLKYASYM